MGSVVAGCQAKTKGSRKVQALLIGASTTSRRNRWPAFFELQFSTVQCVFNVAGLSYLSIKDGTVATSSMFLTEGTLDGHVTQTGVQFELV